MTADRTVPLPDVVIRAAIHRLCSRTALRLATGNAESDAWFADAMAARAIAEQIRVAIERSDLRHNDQVLRLTVSIGVATQLAHETLPQPAVERADKALYVAKNGGRNRVSVAPAVFAPRPATA